MRASRVSIAILAATACAVIGLQVFSARFAPRLIEQAYAGRSFSFLNARIRGQSEHPVVFYQARFTRLSKVLSVAILVVGAVAVVAMRPETTRVLCRIAPPPPLAADCRPMDWSRRLAVNGIIATIIFGHIWCMVSFRELWPWSAYGMYADPMPPKIQTVVIVGVTDKGEEELLQDDRYWYPLDVVRLCFAIRIKKAKRMDIREPLASLLATYEANRLAGRHDGPRLVGMRLYECRWSYNLGLENLNSPDSKELVAEAFRLPGGGQ